MKTLKIPGHGIVKICYGYCNCVPIHLVVYYDRSPAMRFVADIGWAQCAGGKHCRSYIVSVIEADFTSF